MHLSLIFYCPASHSARRLFCNSLNLQWFFERAETKEICSIYNQQWLSLIISHKGKLEEFQITAGDCKMSPCLLRLIKINKFCPLSLDISQVFRKAPLLNSLKKTRVNPFFRRNHCLAFLLCYPIFQSPVPDKHNWRISHNVQTPAVHPAYK